MEEEHKDKPPEIILKKGAKASPPDKIAARPHFGQQHKLLAGVIAPPEFIHIPGPVSPWGSIQYADCVTAEEAFAKACNVPPIFLPDPVVIGWATAHHFLETAPLWAVMEAMKTDGFQYNGHRFDDGQYYPVTFQDPGSLAQAISQAPIKVGVSIDQLGASWKAQGGNNNGAPPGWLALNYHNNPGVEHCIGIFGYGPIGWLAVQLHRAAPMPPGVNPGMLGYAFYSWGSLGVIDSASLLAIAQEAWIRVPTTITE